MAGKGSPAALLAAAVLGMFSAEATYQAGAAPLMTRLNHGLFRRAIEARFLTSFYGMLVARRLADLLQRRPQRAAARLGVRHPPARNRRRRPRPVRHASFEEETLTLEPGDLIVLFSDGVTEAMNAEGEEFTDDRLIACAERASRRDRRSRCSTRCSPTSTRSAPASRRATT